MKLKKIEKVKISICNIFWIFNRVARKILEKKAVVVKQSTDESIKKWGTKIGVHVDKIIMAKNCFYCQ